MNFSESQERPFPSPLSSVVESCRFQALGMVSFLVLAGCESDDLDYREVAIVAPHGMEGPASKICPKDREGGEVVCDPEWEEDLIIDQECYGSFDPVVFDCKPEQLIEGAWIYTLPFESGKVSCWSFKHLPDDYFLATQQGGGGMRPVSELCLDPSKTTQGRFDRDLLLYLRSK